LGACGAPVEVNTEDFSFRHARILDIDYQSVTGVESKGAKTAHFGGPHEVCEKLGASVDPPAGGNLGGMCVKMGLGFK